MTTLDPTTDAGWLAKIDADPSDTSLREAYVAALVGAGDPRGELARVEAQVDATRLDDPGRPALKRRRDQLRDAVDARWRARFDLGRQAGARAPLPWPEDTATRWLVLCEYIEEVRGVRLPEEVWTAFATSGSAATAWGDLIEAVGQDDRDYWALFRDSISRGHVRGWDALHSLMVQGEDDFHWAIDSGQLGDEDPPVHGLTLDHGTGTFVPTRLTRNSNCTCYARVTDFVRGMFETYRDLGRSDRFTGGESVVASRLSEGFATPPTPRPSCEELGTEQFRDREDDEEERSTQLGLISGEEYAALLAMAQDASRPGAPEPPLTVMDASGRLRDDLDTAALVAAVREGDPGLVDGPRNKVILMRVGETEVTLVLQTSEDRRYVVCHIDEEEGDKMLATVAQEDDSDEEVGVMVDGVREEWTAAIFVDRQLASRVVARFVQDGDMDGCVDWWPREDILD